MEEWVGKQWHRFIAKAASREYPSAAVELAQMQRTIGMLFRAAGGDSTMRIATVGDTAVGGPRRWLDRIAGSGTHAAVARLDTQALSLPPRLAVFDDQGLNQHLYLWLAALGAVYEHTDNWVGDNGRATAAALQRFPGLRVRHQALVRAHLSQRPQVHRLHRDRALAESLVQQALAGQWPAQPAPVCPSDVAPVWLWLQAESAPPEAAARAEQDPANSGNASARGASARRRRAQAVTDERDRAPFMMFFRAESILSWGEFIKVNRATDDDPDENASRVADDMDVLAVAPDGQSCASRVRFDLDLPSAAADDRPLGPGERLPEWDWRQQRLLADHCAAQTLVTAAAPAFHPPVALRATARRVRRRLEVLRASRSRLRGQPDGEELDLDALVRHHVESLAVACPESPAVFVRRVNAERSLATLLLADLSLSTDAYATPDARVIDVIRDALYVFGEAMHASGDPFAMLGFSSVRRQHVRMQHLKGFDETWGRATRDRVGAIKPGYYTRMGAAIRLATQRLQQRPERQRLMLILTDGKPNDLDIYEGRYGLEDTRHAVQAARAVGITPLCITIDDQAHDYLPMLFGQNGYVLVHRPQDLVHRLAAIHARFMRAALH